MARRLFMIWTSPIFRDSVHLLLDHPEIEWIGSTSNYTFIQENIQILRPDTIVVEEVEGALPATLIELLESEITIVRLISVTLDDNRLKIYTRENRAVGEAGDLLRLILQ